MVLLQYLGVMAKMCATAAVGQLVEISSISTNGRKSHHIPLYSLLFRTREFSWTSIHFQEILTQLGFLVCLLGASCGFIRSFYFNTNSPVQLPNCVLFSLILVLSRNKSSISGFSFSWSFSFFFFFFSWWCIWEFNHVMSVSIVYS